MPGLIDIHSHTGRGGAPLALADGVTSWVDAGSFGAYAIDQAVGAAASAPNRGRFLINISRLGVAPGGELMDINNADNYAKHGFTHLLGTFDKPGAVLSDTNPAMRPNSATSQDYGWGIREATQGVNGWMNAPQSRPMRYGEEWEKPSAYSDTTNVGAPWHWWK